MNKIAALCLLIISSALVQNAETQAVQEWAATYNGPDNYSDSPVKVLVDNAGYVYVTGTSFSTATQYDYVTIKYEPQGNQVWLARFDNENHLDDFARSLALDAQGNVYVTGFGEGTGSLYDCFTVKYNSAGVQQWMAQYNNTVSYFGDDAQDVVVDANGNVYITGSSSLGYPNGVDFLTIKYNSVGAEQWVRNYNYSGSFDLGLAMTLDPQGNVCMTGFSDQAAFPYPENEDYATVKYSPEGQELWVARFDGQGQSWDQPTDIVSDPDGNFYVTGWCWNGDSWTGYTSDDYTTLKYDPNGVLLWAATYSGQGNGDDRAYAVAVDAQRNVYVTGSANVGTYQDPVNVCTTIKYDASGNQQWVQFYDCPTDGEDSGVAVALDSIANVYVAISSTSYSGQSDFTTVKYDSSGVQQWVVTYNGPSQQNDFTTSLALDAAANVYVTGKSLTSGPLSDYATLKYSQFSTAITVTLVPINPPIVIPASGGNFNFTTTLMNASGTSQTADLWIMTRLPNQSWYGPVLGPLNLTLTAGTSLSRMRVQSVPATAPAGEYWYEARVGDYPAVVSDTSGFAFTKSGSGIQDSGAGDWSCTGEPFPGQSQTALLPSGLDLKAFPNPFNPETAISYKLQAKSQVSLKVYNTAGRLVATLVDEIEEAGQHSVTFDGSKLVSGMYFVRMQAGDFKAVQKIVLLK